MAMVRTPLRVSFVGGGSDLPPGDGAVVSSAIDKFVWCIARRRLDEKVYLTWTKKEIVDRPQDLEHDLARESLLLLGWNEGIELLTFADVPGVGSGLGSSSATCVAMLHAILVLEGYRDEEIDREWLAELACDVAICRLEKLQGRQDEYASAIGGCQFIRFRSGIVRDIETIDLSPHERRVLGDHLLMFRSNGRERRTDEILASFVDSQEFRAGCIEIAISLSDYLKEGDFYEIGDLMAEHHRLKRSGFTKYSDSNDDGILPNGSLAPDGLRFKLCGAGHGGHLLCHVLPERQLVVRKELIDSWGPELPFNLNPNGSELIYKE